MSDSWVRVNGNNGLVFQNHGGGFYMTENNWIKTFGNKNFYHNTGIMRTDGSLHVGAGGNRFIVNTAGNVGIGDTSPSEKLEVNGIIYSNSGGIKFPDGTVQTTASSGGVADNLGNHIATQNIRLNSRWLSNDGSNEGLRTVSYTHLTLPTICSV